MRTFFVLFVMATVTGCATSATTPAGPLSAYDLRADLPEDVRASAPTDDNAEVHTAQLSVGPQGNQAEVELTWRTFEYEGGQYITSATFNVVDPARGLELEAAAGGSPMNVGTEAAPVQLMQFSVSWFRRGAGGTSGGSVIGQFQGDGTFSLNTLDE